MPFLSLRFVSTPGTTAALAYRIALTQGRVYAWSNLVVNMAIERVRLLWEDPDRHAGGPSTASPSTLAVKSQTYDPQVTVDLAPEQLIESACERTGLDDFGGETFRLGLDRLV